MPAALGGEPLADGREATRWLRHHIKMQGRQNYAGLASLNCTEQFCAGAWAAISGLQNMLHNTIEAFPLQLMAEPNISRPLNCTRHFFVQANVIHRNIVISACASVAAWSSAWALLKNFRAASVEATAISSSLGSLPCGS